MHLKKELSDVIAALFSLEPDEFDPAKHLTLAEQVVDKLGKKRSYWVSPADLVQIENKGVVLLDNETERTGNFVLRHIGRLKSAAYLGFHPKIEIVDWKSEMRMPFDDEIETLEIAYEKKRVCGIHKFLQRYHPIIGRQLVFGTLETQWIYMCK